MKKIIALGALVVTSTFFSQISFAKTYCTSSCAIDRSSCTTETILLNSDLSAEYTKKTAQTNPPSCGIDRNDSSYIKGIYQIVNNSGALNITFAGNTLAYVLETSLTTAGKKYSQQEPIQP